MANNSVEQDGHWLWQGVTRKGYGRIWYRGRFWSLHRLAYTLLVEPLPDHLVPDHQCEHHNCWNPAHLKPATTRQNLLNSTKTLAAINAAKVDCKRGHPLSGDNLYISKPRNLRVCRDCVVLGKRARKLGISIDEYVMLYGAEVIRMKNQYV